MAIAYQTNVSSPNNNGGVSVNTAGSLLLSSVSLGNPSTTYGSVVINDGKANPADSNGIFAYNRQRPLAKRLTTTLAGTVDNDFLLSGAADPTNRQNIHQFKALYTTLWSTGFRTNKWNPFTGMWDAGYPQVSNDTSIFVDNDVLLDSAANPSRNIPGTLRITSGSKNSTSVNYSKKTG